MIEKFIIFRDHSLSAHSRYFRKTKIWCPLTRSCTCTYQGVRNVSFPENSANEWSFKEERLIIQINCKWFAICYISEKKLTRFQISLLSMEWKYENTESHCVKSVQMRSYFWSVFSCIRTEYEDLLCNLLIQSEYRKIGTTNNFEFGHFSRSVHHSENVFCNKKNESFLLLFSVGVVFVIPQSRLGFKEGNPFPCSNSNKFNPFHATYFFRYPLKT